MTDGDIQYQFEKANDVLRAARVIIEAEDGLEESAVNRLYYACFHAVSGVLLENGYNPNSHGAVERLFGKEVVLTGDASRDDGRFLSNLYEARQVADYNATSLDITDEPFEMDIDELYERVDQFVEDMEQLAGDY